MFYKRDLAQSLAHTGARNKGAEECRLQGGVSAPLDEQPPVGVTSCEENPHDPTQAKCRTHGWLWICHRQVPNPEYDAWRAQKDRDDKANVQTRDSHRACVDREASSRRVCRTSCQDICR